MGNFDVFTGLPEGDWCPFPPVIGATIGAVTGGPTAIAIFQSRETLFGNEIEVLVDTNLKRAFEADYWKGVLDAQGKDDGTYLSGFLFRLVVCKVAASMSSRSSGRIQVL